MNFPAVNTILWGKSHATENQVHTGRILIMIVSLISKINSTNDTADWFNKYIWMLSNLIQLHVSVEFTYWDRARTHTLGFANSIATCGRGDIRNVSPVLVVTGVTETV